MAADPKTPSELLFEQFLAHHQLPFEPVPETDSPRPDYAVGGGTPWGPILFEVKELTQDDNFKQDQFVVSSRTVGDRIRRKISKSRKQIQFGALLGVPSVLLVYNAIDTVFHLFGTEDHDFMAAMHGEWTLLLSVETRKILNSGHGRNRSLREGQNTSFTALGHLAPHFRSGVMTVRLFPNAYAKMPLPLGLPTCFEIAR